MLNKEQLNKKLQEKRNEQIRFEYKSLEDFKIKYENELSEIKEKMFTIDSEKDILDQSEKNNLIELEKIKNSNISTQVDDLNTNIILIKDAIKKKKI